jgi:carbonic anhydrase
MTTTHDQKSQQALSVEDALRLLREGNQRFMAHEFLHRDFEIQRGATTEGQFPFAVILSCIDSRLPTEIIFDQGIGDVFNVRIAGNVLSGNVLGSLEYACKVAGAKVILVLGHTSCGAVKGACDHVEMGNLTPLLKKIEPAMAKVHTSPGAPRNSSNDDFVNQVAQENVRQSMEGIRKESPILDEMINQGSIGLFGAMYDIQTGKVDFDL